MNQSEENLHYLDVARLEVHDVEGGVHFLVVPQAVQGAHGLCHTEEVCPEWHCHQYNLKVMKSIYGINTFKHHL